MSSPWLGLEGELASWAWSRLRARRDVWGAYYEGGPYTAPARRDRGRVLLTPGRLGRHFAAGGPRDVAGLHPSSADGRARWAAVDIDAHGGDCDPGANLRAALAWHGRARSWGLAAVLEDSNGAGGYHLWLLAYRPVRSGFARAVALTLTDDYADYGLASRPEVFPKSAGCRYGNWLRLPGLHPRRGVWSRVYGGSGWLEGRAAAEALLCVVPRRGVKVRVKFSNDWKNRACPAPEYGCRIPVSYRAEMAVRKWPTGGPGRRHHPAYGLACLLARDLGLSDGQCMSLLCEWDAGNSPPIGPEWLAKILDGARKYGRH